MKKAVLTVLFAVFAWNVYRAAILPILPEEAVSYNSYVSQPVLKLFSQPYNPANQVLHSLLCHLILRIVRVTEFSFRIASLLGLLFYLWQAYRLFPRSWAIFAFAVNPLTLGWLPQSTGFWMAAGLFLFAVRKLLLGRLSETGVALGFAGCFYITFCLPALVIFLVRRRLNELVLPATLIWFCFWALPMVNASPEHLTIARLLPLPNRFTDRTWIEFTPRGSRTERRSSPPSSPSDPGRRKPSDPRSTLFL